MFTYGKKLVFAVMALSFVVAAGAYAVELTEKEAASPVSRDRAQQIALQQVKGGRIVNSEFNDRWFRDNDYEFTVLDDTNRYDIRVDAKTGKVLNVNQKAIFEDSLSAEDRTRFATGSVTPERARAIAMERAPNAMIVDMKRSMDSDSVVYDVDMRGATSEIDMKIDGMTGRIISFDEDRVEANRDSLFMESRSYNRSVDALDAASRNFRANAAGETDRILNTNIPAASAAQLGANARSIEQNAGTNAARDINAADRSIRAMETNATR